MTLKNPSAHPALYIPNGMDIIIYAMHVFLEIGRHAWRINVRIRICLSLGLPQLHTLFVPRSSHNPINYS